MRAGLVTALLALGIAACGDPATNDDRGYTKAPLEDPGLLVQGEPSFPMDELGTPDRPRPEPLAAAATDQPQGDAQGSDEQQAALAPGVTREQFDQGREIFTGQGGCTACHGPNAGGGQLAPDLTDDQWLHVSGPNPEEIAGVIRNGVAQPVEHPAPMPPMGGANLTDDQVQALAAYVASLSAG